jgi:LppP/LprE lipoprotein
MSDGSQSRIVWVVVGAAIVAVGLAVGLYLGLNVLGKHSTNRGVQTAAAPSPPAAAGPATAAPGFTAVPQPGARDNAAACGPDQATAVQSALAQARPPQIAAKTGARWSSTPQGTNYDPCADLSAVLVTVEGATGSSPMQALMFHRGVFLGTGTVDDYSFMTLNSAASSKDMVVVDYRVGKSCTACGDGTTVSVRYKWNGTQVQMLDPAPTEPESASGPSQYVRTQSGRVRCVLTSADPQSANGSVICEAAGPVQNNKGFLQAPMSTLPGVHYHNATVTAAGDFKWGDGNIGGSHPEDDVVLAYGQNFRIQGWTVQPTSDGTRFTNDRTGHGMFVSIENVNSF